MKIKHILGNVTPERAEKIDEMFVGFWREIPKQGRFDFQAMLQEVMEVEYGVRLIGVTKGQFVLAYDPDDDQFSIARVTLIDPERCRVSNGLKTWTVDFVSPLDRQHAEVREAVTAEPEVTKTTSNPLTFDATRPVLAVSNDGQSAMWAYTQREDGRLLGVWARRYNKPVEVATSVTTHPANVALYSPGLPVKVGDHVFAYWEDKDNPEAVAGMYPANVVNVSPKGVRIEFVEDKVRMTCEAERVFARI